VLDATAGVSTEEADVLRSLDGRPRLVVRNKADLMSALQELPEQREPDSLLTSALTGAGLAELRARILRLLHAEGDAATGGVLNSLRQQQAVEAALESLAAAAAANESKIPHEFLLADLHGALRALDSLTGQTTSDDILNRIFSTFCIGK
jgi:tRNA modification GTPase